MQNYTKNSLEIKRAEGFANCNRLIDSELPIFMAKTTN